ncbi:TPA: GPW/gp25 family protein [Escherichia coli]|nr:GPW/gp25 family protein [Escherichia coli]
MSTGYTGMNHAGPGTLTDIDHLNQSITDILLTPEGSRVMRRGYGSNLPALLDSPANEITRLRCMSAAVIAITRWEPRVAINGIDLTWKSNGGTVLSMNYLIVNTLQSVNYSVDIQGGKDANH